MSPDDWKTTPLWRSDGLIGEDELFGTLGEGRGTTLFLGKFTMAEVLAVMGRMGILKEARKRKLWPLAFDLDSSAFPLQRFRIFVREKTADNLIVDLKIREGAFPPKPGGSPGAPGRDLAALVLEWLTLQNPIAEFTEHHGALPGQQHPGLGMSRKVMDIFIYLGRVTRRDVILAFPAFYHNAVLFSRYFRFYDPRKEGEVQAIRRTFSHMPIKQLAWAVYLDCLRAADGSVYEWTAAEQMYPFARDLKDYFESKNYRESVKDVLRQSAFTIDPEEFDRKVGSFD